MPSIVQFIHPQWEHKYDSFYKDKKYYKEWHDGAHCRKFVINKGSYVDNNIKHDDSTLLFWCEWEPTSLVEKLEQPKSVLLNEVYPKYLHTPFLPSLEKIKEYQKRGYQNTDPFVFGKYFKYSICKQDHYPCMKNLERGSLILFGSCVKSRFVIDTVFVVKDKIPYITPVTEEIEFPNNYIESNIFSEIVLKMRCKEKIKEEQKTRILYIGASYDDTNESINKMYSFVPSIKYEGKKIGFPRLYLPNIDKINNYFSKWTKAKKIISNNLKQGLLHNDNININEIEYLWNIIKDTTLEKYVLGYNFEMPKEDISFKK
jgi:hypothetical protein